MGRFDLHDDFNKMIDSFLLHHLDPISYLAERSHKYTGIEKRRREVGDQIEALTSDLIHGPITLTDDQLALFDEYNSLVMSVAQHKAKICYLRGIVEGIHLTDLVGLSSDSLHDAKDQLDHLGQLYGVFQNRRERHLRRKNNSADEATNNEAADSKV